MLSAHRGTFLPVALSGLCACALVHERAEEQVPPSRPAGDEGMLIYTVGRLSFEAPQGWEARGDGRHVLLVSPQGDARLDGQLAAEPFADDRVCLEKAEAALVRGESRLVNVRRHPTTLAGRKAVVQEADEPGWHGWAWAVCDGGEQYRLFLTGRSPLSEEAVRAARLLSSSAVLSARPGA
ncbi:MAG TPA: hypothetical protein VMG32_10810 [Anaeromyxobacteraceae bacterium]|nr:hypothetical protein [Anaeromyxobacteraceae bacterium]